MIMDWMDHPDHIAYVNGVLGIKSSGFEPYMQGKRRKHDAAIENVDLDYLMELNRWDLELYEYAKDLTRARIDSFMEDKPYGYADTSFSIDADCEDGGYQQTGRALGQSVHLRGLSTTSSPFTTKRPPACMKPYLRD